MRGLHKNSTCDALIYLRVFVVFGFLLNSYFSLSHFDSKKSESISVRQFNIEHGLNQSMVTCMFQDYEGVLWLGTGSGLNYFDGRNMHFVDFSNRKDLNSTIIRKIEKTTNQDFLMCVTGEIGFFDRHNFAFKSIYKSYKSDPALLFSHRDLLHLFWSADDGFFALLSFSSMAVLFPLDALNERELEPKSAVLTNDFTLLISCYQGVVAYDFDKVLNFLTNIKQASSLVQNSKNDTYVLSKNELFLWEKGTLIFQNNTDFLYPGCASFDQESNLWVFDMTKSELSKTTLHSTTNVSLVTREGKYNDTIKPHIKFIQFDGQGNMFVGTDGFGLLIHNWSKFDFLRSEVGFTHGISSTKNFLWVNTYMNGLWKMSKDLKNKSRVQNPLIKENEQILSLVDEARNFLFVVTKTEVVVLDENEQIIDRWKPDDGLGFYSGRLFFVGHDTLIFHIPRSASYKVFCETYLLTFQNNKLEQLDFSIQDECVVNLNYWKNNFWLASRNALFFNDKPTIENAKRIAEGKFYAFAKRQNEIFASSKKELFKIDMASLKVASNPLNDRSNTAHKSKYGLITDSQDNVWFSSNSGIGCILKNDSVFYFDKAFNYQSMEFSAKAYHSDGDIIYFGGIQGVNAVDSKLFHEEFSKLNPSNLALISLTLADETTSLGLPKKGVDFELSQHNTKISGKVSSSELEYPESHKFAFYLKNYDKNWSFPKSSNDFEYDRLPPGNYELYCKNLNIYGKWSESKFLFSVSIPAFFYQTIWFQMALILSAIVFLVFFVRYWQARKYKRVITEINRARALDQERLRIARDVHDELGGGLSKMLVISQLIESKKNDISKVQELSASVGETCKTLLENLSDVVWSLKNEKLSASEFQARLTEYCADLFENSHINVHLEIQGEAPPDYHCSKDFVKNVFPACKEALTNIIKHAKPENVRVSLIFLEGYLTIKIEDDGVGLPESKLSGNGLANMKFRIEKCGGEFILESISRKGTRIIFKKLPLEKKLN